MLIRCNHTNAGDLAWLVKKQIGESRFTADVDVTHKQSYGQCVEIRNVRLRNRKGYCGQHPNECIANPFVRKRHLKGRRLEGADWIGFNDMLNDLLDRYGINADAWTYNGEAGRERKDWTPGSRRSRLVRGRYFVRKGRERRVSYDSGFAAATMIGFYYWLLDGEHADYCGKAAPRSRYPAGTPGVADWRVESEAVCEV